jgi:hypothetical protein
MSADYSGLTRNNWTGTWSPTGAFPIVLDTEIRGGLQSISGVSGDRLTDITGQRLVEGMLVYLKAGYTVGDVTRASNSYFTYKLLFVGGILQTRDANTGEVPNAEANWTVSEIGSSVTVVDTVADGNANAVSSNAVFDALSDKAPLDYPLFNNIAVKGTTGSGGYDGSITFQYRGDSTFNGLLRSANFTGYRSIFLPDAGGTIPVYTGAAAVGKVLTSTGTTGVATWQDAATGSGTVTSVSVTTANGVSGSVATSTTTPAITLTLGAITPTSVNGNTISVGTGTLTLSSYTLTVAGTASVSGTNTGDQTNITGNAATVTTNANLSGHVNSSGNTTSLGSFTIAQLNTAVSDADVASAASVALKINSDITGVDATQITNIIQVTQSVYNGLSPIASTVYIIVG